MALIPAVPLTSGDEYTEEIANLAFNQVFDDQPQYLGHHPRLTDDSLSFAPGSLRSRFKAVEDAFRVSVESGLTLRYQSGIVRLGLGQNLSIASALINAPDNSTSYVYIDQTGVINCNPAPNVNRLMLAKVVTVAGQVSVLEDLRHPSILPLAPASDAIKVFGGSNGIDKVATQGEVFDQGLYYYRNFTIPGGVTVTIDKFAKFFCSGKVDLIGDVTVSKVATGAAPYSTGLNAVGAVGGLSGSGLGAGSGSSSGSGLSYNYGAQTTGSGGGIGFATGQTGSSMSFGGGGNGGGCLWIEAAGAIKVGGAIFADGGIGGFGLILAGNCRISGSGGGSGGLILLSSLVSVTVNASANLAVRGGTGGPGVNNITGQSAMGGSGGGGGQVVLISPNNNTTGSTILLSGGAMGVANGANPSELGGGGGGGFGGNGGNQSAGSIGKLIIRPFIPVA